MNPATKIFEEQALSSGEHVDPSSIAIRSALLFALAAVSGGAGWSGQPSLSYLAMLYPFVYLHSRRRLDALSATAYYAASTWSVVPASRGFFGAHSSPTQPFIIWLTLIVLSSAPWVALFNRRFLPFSAIASLVILAVPPLGLVTVTHPLIAAGCWFPGSRWLGLVLPIILIGAYRHLGLWMTLAILLSASLLGNMLFHRSSGDPRIIALDTNFGGADTGSTRLESETRELALQSMALAHPETLVIFPESILPGWSEGRESRWAATFAQLNQQRTGILIGTTMPIPNTEANRNVLLSRGYSERLSYVQRVPVPLGMWRLASNREGFPLMLRYPSTIRVWNRRAGVLICYEQLLVWPAVETLARNPEMLIAPSNLYWASATSIPAIQHVSVQDWADLWAIPLYEASNR